METKESENAVKPTQEKSNENVKTTLLLNASLDIVAHTNSGVTTPVITEVLTTEEASSGSQRIENRSRGDISPSQVVTAFDVRYSMMMSGNDGNSAVVAEADGSRRSSVKQIENAVENEKVELIDAVGELNSPVDYSNEHEDAVAAIEPLSGIADNASVNTHERNTSTGAAENGRNQPEVDDDTVAVNEKGNAEEASNSSMVKDVVSGDGESEDLSTSSDSDGDEAPKRYAGLASEKLIAEELKSSLANVTTKGVVQPTRIFKESVKKRRSTIRKKEDEENIEFMEKKLRKTSRSSSSSSDDVTEDRPIVDYRDLPSVKDRIGNLGDFFCSVGLA